MEQNREPRKNPHINGQLIFNKGGNNGKWKKDSAGKPGQLYVNQ